MLLPYCCCGVLCLLRVNDMRGVHTLLVRMDLGLTAFIVRPLGFERLEPDGEG